MTHAPICPLPAANRNTPDAKDARHQAAVALSHSTKLLADDSFQWFLENCIQPAIAEAETAALDPATDSETCDRQRHVRAALVAVRDWTQQQRDSNKTQVEA